MGDQAYKAWFTSTRDNFLYQRKEKVDLGIIFGGCLVPKKWRTHQQRPIGPVCRTDEAQSSTHQPISVRWTVGSLPIQWRDETCIKIARNFMMKDIERGFSFRTQDKLKEFCRKNNINFELWNYDPELQVHHTRILEIINYCSMGDYEVALSLVEKVRLLHVDWRISQRWYAKFLKYFWRTYFITVRCNLECGRSYNLTILNDLLDGIYLHIQGLPGQPAISEYMKAQCNRFEGDSLVLLEEYNAWKLLSNRK